MLDKLRYKLFDNVCLVKTIKTRPLTTKVKHKSTRMTTIHKYKKFYFLKRQEINNLQQSKIPNRVIAKDVQNCTYFLT